MSLSKLQELVMDRKYGMLQSMGSQIVRHDWATELNWTEWPSGFPYFLQFKGELFNEELIISTTVRSSSCFCWLYRVSPSSAAKNKFNLISILTIWWCPYVQSSLLLLEEGLCYYLLLSSLDKALLTFTLLHFFLQGQTCLVLQLSLGFLFCIPIPYDEKDIFLWW